MAKLTVNLPDFIIIGANKAGTTSIANYLGQHNEIKMSAVKEPMFFSCDPMKESSARRKASLGAPYFSATLEEYSSMFDGAKDSEGLFGDASTSYLANPAISAKQIKKIVPDVKVIAVLREPASRALSAYKMCLGNGIENRSFKEIVKAAQHEKTIKQGHGVKEYFRNGLYSQLLQPYSRLFDQENMLFLKYEDLSNSPDVFMDRLLNFIGASSFQFNTKKRFNKATDNLSKQLEIDPEDMAKLAALYQDDIAKTEELTSLDLTSWKV